MTDELIEDYTVTFNVIKSKILVENNEGDDDENSKRELNEVEWENFKKILDSNSQSYIDRCLWILGQIEES